MPNGTKVSTVTVSPGAIRSTGLIRASNEPVWVLLGMSLISWSAAAADKVMALVGKGFPVLALAARDKSEPSMVDAADQLADKGAAIFITSDLPTKATPLPFAATGHPLTDPLAAMIVDEPEAKGEV